MPSFQLQNARNSLIKKLTKLIKKISLNHMSSIQKKASQKLNALARLSPLFDTQKLKKG